MGGAAEQDGGHDGIFFAQLAASLLLDGVTFGSTVAELCDRGCKQFAAEAIVTDALSHPFMTAAFERSRALKKLNGLLQCYSSLWKRGHPSNVVDEVTARSFSGDSFRHNYYYRHAPIVIREGAVHWCTPGTFTPEHLASTLGDTEIEYLVGVRHGSVEYETRRSSMASYLAKMEKLRCGNAFYAVIANVDLPASPLRTMLDECDTRDIRPELHIGKARLVRLWAGPRGTVSQLHHDALSVMFVQLYGKKRFVLAPAFETPKLYNARGIFSAVDPVAPDLYHHPEAQNVNWLYTTVSPGDVLFIPVGWWHWVYAESASLSLSLTDFTVDGNSDAWGTVTL